jgi:hypothetical protein
MTEIEAAEMAHELSLHMDAISRLGAYATTNAKMLAFHKAEAGIIANTLAGWVLV